MLTLACVGVGYYHPNISLLPRFNLCIFFLVAGNVDEYLELSNKAANDPVKMKNIKLVFEKKNQASAQTIAKLQVNKLIAVALIQ